MVHISSDCFMLAFSIIFSSFLLRKGGVKASLSLLFHFYIFFNFVACFGFGLATSMRDTYDISVP